MNKMNYLNVGCGNKFHKAWVNVDMSSNSPHVKSYNLLNGIPFPDDQFDVVYHSQVLEHFSKEKAPSFARECFRVLKPGGIMRVVVPDLENIVREYIKHLNENIRNSNSQSEADYDWILLEMYDQTVRNYSGGQMAEFLRQPELINESYIIDRIGYVGRTIRNSYLTAENSMQPTSNLTGVMKKVKSAGVRKIIRYIIGRISSSIYSEAKRIGQFRLSGEIHMWMYDRFSLSRLLKEVGFEEIEIKTPYESSIPEWDKYELDIKNGAVFDPTSLFMEARKPR
jgi:predicted SAM-dependent methyltransferase